VIQLKAHILRTLKEYGYPVHVTYGHAFEVEIARAGKYAKDAVRFVISGLDVDGTLLSHSRVPDGMDKFHVSMADEFFLEKMIAYLNELSDKIKSSRY